VLSNSARLDRFLSVRLGIKRGDVRLLLAQKRIEVDGVFATSRQARYLMMNKPAGVVSATKDDKHKTVVDLLSSGEGAGLHIPGRLDFNTTGLLLLTDDGRWSRQLSLPERNIAKVYTALLAQPLDDSYIAAFAAGMYFSYEDVTTRPVSLEIISDYVARLRLVEGRYHQIKRMFGRFQNEVLALHRDAIGSVVLDPGLALGQYRNLTQDEILALAC
jgi:16S rRNA pseudouridine516 synthase